MNVIAEPAVCIWSGHKNTVVLHILAGKNSAGQPITEEQRNQYSNNLGAVSRHYKQLQMQYNLLRSGVVCDCLLSISLHLLHLALLYHTGSLPHVLPANVQAVISCVSTCATCPV